MKEHHYAMTIQWTGNLGSGTSHYKEYSRDHLIQAEGKIPLEGSSDAAFRGNHHKYNPEELLLASLSSCHMLWYLHLCADAGIVVTHYEDHPIGTMIEDLQGGGQFKEVTLRPKVKLAAAHRIEEAMQLHEKANAYCFIARSVNFPVLHAPACTI